MKKFYQQKSEQEMFKMLIHILMKKDGMTRDEAWDLLKKTATYISRTADLGVDPEDAIIDMLGLAPKDWILELLV